VKPGLNEVSWKGTNVSEALAFRNMKKTSEHYALEALAQSDILSITVSH